MGSLFAYSLSTALVLALLYLGYKWLFADSNNHRFNRALLLAIYLLSFTALPLYAWISHLKLFQPESITPSIAVDTSNIIGIISDSEVSDTIPLWFSWISAIYIIGLSVITLLTVISIAHLAILIAHSDYKKLEGYHIVVSDSIKYAPFSIGNIIVLSSEDFFDDSGMILLHEKSHISLHHWVDLLIAQLVCIFQWFNPAAWLMRDELRTVHEYQADECVINKGVRIKEYQMLLIKKAVAAKFPAFANSLNHSKLRKRIDMMFRKKKKGAAWHTIVFIPVLILVIWMTQIPVVASVFDKFRNSSLLPEPKEHASINKSIKPHHRDVTKSINSPQTLIITADETDSPVNENKNTSESNDYETEEETILHPNNNIDNDTPENAVEETTEYIGESKAMMQNIKENSIYPEENKEEEIQGKELKSESDISHKRPTAKKKSWNSFISENDRIFVNGQQLVGDENSILKQLDDIDPSTIDNISIDKSRRKNGTDILIVLKS